MKVYSELPEVNWDSCGFDACSGAGNVPGYPTASRLALNLTIVNRVTIPWR